LKDTTLGTSVRQKTDKASIEGNGSSNSYIKAACRTSKVKC